MGDTYNGGHNKNYSGSVALDAKITDRLTWTFDGFYMKTWQQGEVNTVSVGSGVTHLATVPGDTNFGAKGTWKTNEMNVFTTGLNWEINDNWKATLSLRQSKLDENFPGNLITITNNAGDYTDSAFFVKRAFWYTQGRVALEGRLTTGSVSHQILFGVEKQINNWDSDAKSLVTHALDTGNIYTNFHPTLANYPASNWSPVLYRLNSYKQSSVFGADTIDWGQWSLLVGLRYTAYQDTNLGSTGNTVAVYNAYPITPSFALTYKFPAHTNIYVSYVEGLQNGGQAGTSNKNYPDTFGPIRSKQYEAGLKTDHSTWNGSLALFRTIQGAGYTNAANYYVQDGQVRYQGVEASGSVRPNAAWVLGASVRYVEPTYLKTASLYIGKDVPGVAREQATVNVTYLPTRVPGLTLDASVRYTGKGYGNTLNTLAFPSYTTADLGATFTTKIRGKSVSFRGSVKNVGDERYWVYGSQTVIPGEPRTVSLSTHLDF